METLIGLGMMISVIVVLGTIFGFQVAAAENVEKVLMNTVGDFFRMIHLPNRARVLALSVYCIGALMCAPHFGAKTTFFLALVGLFMMNFVFFLSESIFSFLNTSVRGRRQNP